MAISEQRRPYEFLARWDELTGKFRGAHIQFFDGIIKDGRVIAGQPSAAYSVGAGTDFPLTDIMNAMAVEVLAQHAELSAQIAKRDSEMDRLEAEIERLKSALTEKQRS